MLHFDILASVANSKGNSIFFFFIQTKSREFRNIENQQQHMDYDTIISLIELPALIVGELLAFKFACFNVSFTSRRNNDRF